MNLYERAADIFGRNGAPMGAPAKMPNQAKSDATTVAGVKDDLNALLTALKAAGLMEADD